MKVFIGSSREQFKSAEKVAEWLEEWKCDPVLGTDDEAFLVGEYTFESLNKISSEVDAAVFVFGGDDETWYRDRSVKSIRDNVLIEYGLFCGKLSRQRVAFICKDDPVIATDLLGITHANIEQSYRVKRILKKWIDGISQTIVLETKMNLPPKGEFRITNLFEAFQIVFSEGHELKNFRVFAISTYKSVQMLRLIPDLKIQKADILLREYIENDCFFEKDMEGAIEKAIISWKTMVEKDNISSLNLSFFNYHPGEGFYIFDNRYLIIGYLNYDAQLHQSGFADKVVVVDSSTEAGKIWIQCYIERFEQIYANYKYKETKLT